MNNSKDVDIGSKLPGWLGTYESTLGRLISTRPAIVAFVMGPQAWGSVAMELGDHGRTDYALERERQIELWGSDSLAEDLRSAVLMEEVGEVARAICENEGDARLLEEIVQVGAVAMRIAEDMLLRMKR
jgi:hypothetical protein